MNRHRCRLYPPFPALSRLPDDIRAHSLRTFSQKKEKTECAFHLSNPTKTVSTFGKTKVLTVFPKVPTVFSIVLTVFTTILQMPETGLLSKKDGIHFALLRKRTNFAVAQNKQLCVTAHSAPTTGMRFAQLHILIYYVHIQNPPETGTSST